MVSKKIKVAVLMGGPSSERAVSLDSGRCVCEALKDTQYQPIPVDTVDNWEEVLLDIRPDVSFVALHGKFGEDGTVQSILEQINIPYTGSGIEASRLAMDKIASKNIFQSAGIAVPEFSVIKKPSYDILEDIGFPLVIKPSSQGSSIGLAIIESCNKAQIKKAMDLAYVFDEQILAEKFIKGQELTVGILDDKALPVIKISPKRKFYDYKAKYIDNQTQYLVPAPIEDRLAKMAQGLALKAHKSLGCRAFSRVDMILGQDGVIRILEVNSIPGFTSHSLLPKAAAAVGIDFKQLCIKIIELALAG